MGFNGTTIINQLGFHEQINVVDNAEGPIYLDLHLSTTHVIYPKNNISVFIESIPQEDNIPANSFIDCTILIFSKYADIDVELDPTFIIANNTMNNKIHLVNNYLASINLYSTNSGYTWRASSTIYNAINDGYSMLDTSTSNTIFNGCISTSLNTIDINITPKITLDFINNIALGSGDIKIIQIGD